MVEKDKPCLSRLLSLISDEFVHRFLIQIRFLLIIMSADGHFDWGNNSSVVIIKSPPVRPSSSADIVIISDP